MNGLLLKTYRKWEVDDTVKHATSSLNGVFFLFEIAYFGLGVRLFVNYLSESIFIIQNALKLTRNSNNITLPDNPSLKSRQQSRHHDNKRRQAYEDQKGPTTDLM